MLSDRYLPIANASSILVDFAVVDFGKGTAAWLELPQHLPDQLEDRVLPVPTAPLVAQVLPRELIWAGPQEDSSWKEEYSRLPARRK